MEAMIPYLKESFGHPQSLHDGDRKEATEEAEKEGSIEATCASRKRSL